MWLMVISFERLDVAKPKLAVLVIFFTVLIQ